ncbi:MAG: thiamine pyrophosphate-binding protein [Gemmatimonadales bacterium]
MTVSYENSRIIYDGIKAAGIRSASALPETWLGLLLQRAEDDPGFDLVQVAKEEEAIGIAAGAYFAGTPHVLLMQNHGFLAAINGIVSLAQLYGIPLCMLIAFRGHWGEPYPGIRAEASSRRGCCARSTFRSSTPATRGRSRGRSARHGPSRKAPSPPSRCS